MAEPAIAARSVSAGYGQRKVLDDVSLQVRVGEVVGLLGPNGCGKTTLLNVLCGAVPAWSGGVQIGGKDLGTFRVRDLARQIGYVPQRENHHFEFTVAELVLMGRIAHSGALMETAADLEAADRALERVGCSGLGGRLYSTLSGGEAQRVLIARALAQEAPVLLCDEPTAHLDPGHQVEVGVLLTDLAATGHAVVVTTHDLNWALRFCSRAVLLAEKTVAFDGNLTDAVAAGTLDRVYGSGFRWIPDGDRFALLPA